MDFTSSIIDQEILWIFGSDFKFFIGRKTKLLVFYRFFLPTEAAIDVFSVEDVRAIPGVAHSNGVRPFPIIVGLDTLVEPGND